MSTTNLNTASIATSIVSSAYPCVLVERAARKRFQLAWKAFLREHKKPSPIVFVAYCLLRGKPLTRAFSPIIRPSKLANGRRPYDSLGNAIRTLQFLTRREWVIPFLAQLGLCLEEQKALYQLLCVTDEELLLLEQRSRVA